jgi:hypothetical protein
VPQSPQQNRDTFSQNAVSGAEMRQAPLLSSSDSGMIVLSSSARILHMNGPARALMALFGTSHEHSTYWHNSGVESRPRIGHNSKCAASATWSHHPSSSQDSEFRAHRIVRSVSF